MDEQTIFLQALDRPIGEQRNAWLDHVCGIDSPLRQRINGLISEHEQVGRAALCHEPETMIVGSAGHSILNQLDQTIDFMPRITLRDTVEEVAGPIGQPTSTEGLQRDSSSRYQLQGEIARGGMGAILKGRDIDLGRDLAIKVLLDQHKDKREVIQRFIEEAQIGGQLQHPGIAPVYELGQFADKRPFFSMKLVKGKTLSKLLAARKDPIEDRGRFLGIFVQICQTMAYAHSRGVIHRDLKPANIMVGAFGEVQVMDWGLAKVLPSGTIADEKKSQLFKQQDKSIIQTLRSNGGSNTPSGAVDSETQMGTVMGTLAYMPPEQALGEIDQLDERADVFGLGAILSEVLTGDPPYVGSDWTQVFRLASRGNLDDCFERLAVSGADEDLIQLTKHCLKLEPTDRPRDAGVLAQRVTRYLESVEQKLHETELQRAAQEARADAEALQAAAERQHAEAESARAQAELQRRKTTLALAASLLLLVGLGGSGWLYLLRQEADREKAEAAAQRRHAGEMQALAEELDEQRIKAVEARGTAEKAQKEAEQERVAAVKSRQVAEAAEEQARQQVVRLHVGKGNAFLAGQDHGPALLWFGRAWFSDAAVGAHETNHRLRLGQILNNDPELTGLAILDAPILRSAIDGAGRLAIALTAKRQAYLCNLETGQKTPLVHPDHVTAIDFRPAGDRAVTASVDGLAHVWDTATGRPLHTLDHGTSVECVALSVEGNLVATAGGKSGVKLWDAETGQSFGVAPTVPDAYFVTFDRTGAKLLTADASGFARVWDTATGAPLCQPRPYERFQGNEGNEGPVFTPDGTRVITYVTDKTDGHSKMGLRAWLAVDGAEPLWGPVPVVHPTDYAFSPNGKCLLIAIVDKAALIDLATGKMLAQVKNRRQTQVVCFASDNAFLTSSSGGWLQEWVIGDDPSTSNIIASPARVWAHGTATFWKLSAVPGRGVFTAGDDGALRFYSDPASKPKREYAFDCGRAHLLQPQFDAQYRTQAVFSSDGLIECRYAPNRLAKVGPRGAAELPITLATTKPVTFARFCSTGEVLLTYDGQDFQSWRAASGMTIGPSVKSIGQSVLAISNDGALLAVGPVNGHEVKVYDMATGQAQQTIPIEYEPRLLEFSPDGRLLAIGAVTNSHIIWDIPGRVRLNRLNVDGGGVLADIKFSDDSKNLISSSSDTTARLFDARAGLPAGPPLRAGTFVWQASLAPDGRRAATKDAEGKVQLWDATTGEEIGQWKLDSITSYRIWFSRDGGRLIVDIHGGRAFEISPFTQPPDSLPPLLELLTGRRIDPATDGIEYLPADRFTKSPGAYTSAWRKWRYTRQNETETRDPSEKLAAAYFLTGDEAAISKVLMAGPQLTAAIAGLHLVDEEWQQAISLCDMAIIGQTADAPLLVIRGKAHSAMGRTEQAIADLKQSLELQPTEETADLLGSLLTHRWTLHNWDELFIRLGRENEASGLSLLKNGLADSVTEPATIEGQNCRFVQSGFAYFTIDDKFKSVPTMDAQIDVEYWDDVSGSFSIEYDSPTHAFRHCLERVSLNGTRQWKRAHFDLRNARFANSQSGRSDFRIAVSDGLHLRRTSLQRIHAGTQRKGWEALTVAYHLTGDDAALLNVLSSHPEVSSLVASLHLADKKWQQAISVCDNVITSQTTDAALFHIRGHAHSALGQTEPAIADLKRVLELQPSPETAGLLADLLALQNWPEQFILVGRENHPRGITLVDSEADGVTQPVDVEGQTCRHIQAIGTISYAYFRLDDKFKWTTGMDAIVEIDYWNDGSGNFTLQYDTSADHFCRALERASITGSKEWKTARFTLTNAQFANSQNGRSDFRLDVNGADLHFRRVSLQHIHPTDTHDPWVKLMQVYHLTGDKSALSKLLQAHPESAAKFASRNFDSTD